jgi:hypothetical protein
MEWKQRKMHKGWVEKNEINLANAVRNKVRIPKWSIEKSSR